MAGKSLNSKTDTRTAENKIKPLLVKGQKKKFPETTEKKHKRFIGAVATIASIFSCLVIIFIYTFFF